MKKILALMLAFVMLFATVALCSCNKDDDEEDVLTLDDIEKNAKDAGWECERMKAEDAPDGSFPEGMIEALQAGDYSSDKEIGVEAALFDTVEHAEAALEEIPEEYVSKVIGTIAIYASSQEALDLAIKK